VISDTPKPYQCSVRPGSCHELHPTSRFGPDEVEQLILDINALPIPPPHPFTVPREISFAIQKADSDREVISIQRDELTNELFVHLWAHEDPYPLVVTPVPGQKLLQYPWSLEFFTSLTGRIMCHVKDCETGDIIPMMVGDFYAQFGNKHDGKRVLKLKVLPFGRFTMRTWTHNLFCLGLPFLRALPDYHSILLSLFWSDECSPSERLYKIRRLSQYYVILSKRCC
jgi:hypothetical protein